MERRGFIKTGLATVVAGASGHLAFGEIIVPMGENITQTEMEDFTREMDISMDHLSHSGGNYLKSLIPQTPTETEHNFFRSSLRTLLLIGNFGDLPIKGQVHPWMQKRMLYSAPEVSFSVTTSFDILRNMSDESKEEIRSALIDDPDLGGHILETLDLEARSIGVTSVRRKQMRIMGSRIIRRLRHSPEMLINEYVKKAEKLFSASNSDEAMEHLLKTQVGEIKYSTLRNEAESAALEWSRLNIPDIPVGYNPIITEQEYDKPLKKKSNQKNIIGLGLLGVSLVLTGVGWLMIAIGPSMVGIVLGITIGPILILIALLALIISGIKSRKSKE